MKAAQVMVRDVITVPATATVIPRIPNNAILVYVREVLLIMKDADEWPRNCERAFREYLETWWFLAARRK